MPGDIQSPGPAPAPAARAQRSLTWLFVAPALLVLILGFILPLIVVILVSVSQGDGFGLAAYREVLASPVFADILWRTVVMAFGCTLIATLIAYPFAHVLATRLHRFAPLILALVSVPYLTSILIRSYAWVAVLGGNGLVNRALISLGVIEYPVKLIYNPFGSYIGTIHIMLPLMILPIYAAMRRIDPLAMRAAAALSAGPISAFFTIWLPLSLPGVLAGALLVFLNVMGFYVTPALLGAPGDYLIAQAIEVRVSTLGEFGVASALSTILLLLVGGCLLLARNRIFAGSSMPGAATAGPRGAGNDDGLRAGLLAGPGRALLQLFAGIETGLGRILAALGIPYAGLVLVFLLLPMIVVVVISFSGDAFLSFPPRSYGLRWFTAFFDDSRWTSAMLFSLTMALASAATAVLVSIPFTLALSRARFRGMQAMWLLAIAPMILPNIVIGLGLFFAVVRIGLNGHPVSFWIAYTTIGIPYVVVILGAAFARFDIGLERAAVSLGATPLTAFRTVTFPILAMSFATAFLFAFLMTFDELIIGLFLSSPQLTPLPVRMWEDISMEISPKTAAVGTLQLAVLIGAMLIGFIYRWLGARRAA